MELNFSHKGLLSFDASTLRRTAEEASLFSTSSASAGTRSGTSQEATPFISKLNLSHNAIEAFCGGETLRHVTVLNLSYNALQTLSARSLPPNLISLVLSYNNLCELPGLATAVQRLEQLALAHNSLTTAGLSQLPASLVTLDLQRNALQTLDVLSPLVRLVRLNVAGNQLRRLDSVESVKELRSLRQLDLRDNAVMKQAGAANFIESLAPRLTHLNGAPLSQAAGNRQSKAARAAPPPARRGSRPSISNNRSSTSSLSPLRRQRSGSQRLQEQPRMEIRLMQTKVIELRRLVAEAHEAEQQGRHQRGLLLEQVKGCGQVISSQAVTLETLQREIAALSADADGLRKPLAELEQAFEQTHATLIAQKADMSIKP